IVVSSDSELARTRLTELCGTRSNGRVRGYTRNKSIARLGHLKLASAGKQRATSVKHVNNLVSEVILFVQTVSVSGTAAGIMTLNLSKVTLFKTSVNFVALLSVASNGSKLSGEPLSRLHSGKLTLLRGSLNRSLQLSQLGI